MVPLVPDLARPAFADLEHLHIDRIVDGDTVRALRGCESVTVRRIGVERSEAKLRYGPCSVCGPPR